MGGRIVGEIRNETWCGEFQVDFALPHHTQRNVRNSFSEDFFSKSQILSIVQIKVLSFQSSDWEGKTDRNWRENVTIILIDVKLPPLLWPHWNIFQSSLSKQLAAMILSDTWNTLGRGRTKTETKSSSPYYCCHPVGRSYTIPYLMVMRCFKVTQHIYLQREGSKIREEECA